MTKRFGLFWLFPVDLLLRQRFDSIQKISSLQMPVLFIHGNRDPQIPARMSQTLFEAKIILSSVKATESIMRSVVMV
ncbi:MAG: hypothetical protein AB4426_33100 [Xenococcaceae cyanobacterium]